MRVRIHPLVALLILSLLTAPVDAAQRKRAEEPPPQFKVDVATKTIALQRLALSVPAGSVVGRYASGLVCITGAQPIYSEHAFAGVPTKDYAAVFAGEAAKAGYSVTSVQSGDLFDTDEAQKAELVVGAAIKTAKVDGCGGTALLGIFVDAALTVEWQVFDPLEKKIVYRTTNQGVAKFNASQGSETFPIQAARAAFQQAAKAVLADPAFLAAVKDPRGGPPRGGDQGLFPEASATPSAAPAQTEIPRLPLRTAGFREQLPDLRLQVVTVRAGQGTGSGFYIGDGLIMTNQHVVSGFRDVRIRFFGGREIPGEVVKTDARRDVALIKAVGGGVTGLALKLDKPEIAAQVFVIGSPLGDENEGTVTSGIVSAFRTSDDGPLIQSDVAVTHGNSGGPMFDDKGNVIALVVSGRTDDRGLPVDLNFFIPIADALKTLGLAVEGTATAESAHPGAGSPGREIQVAMYPAAGPFKQKGSTQALPGKVTGVGTSGSFAFTRPDGVQCEGRWTTLQNQPQADSLIAKHQAVTGISATIAGMVGGLAIGTCANASTFQAEYYAVPGADSGFGVATDSDGNVYKLIF